MIYLSHPTGNANVRAALCGLADAHLLARFYTTVASFPDSMLGKLSQFSSFAEIERRNYPNFLQPISYRFPFYEIGRLLSIKAGISKLTEHEKGFFSIDRVYQQLDKRMANDLRKTKDNIKAVYCYEDAGEYSFIEAKKKGIKCLYDLPIGYWRSARRLLAEEKEKWPDWAATLTGFKDSDTKLKRKDNELHHADSIFVASSFTAETLKEYPSQLSEINVIPYGFPPVAEDRHYVGALSRKAIKVLYVGSLTQRKGIANLFAAIDALQNIVELTIVGQKVSNQCHVLDKALAKHRWYPSLSHNDILNLMRNHDVLVFPSLFEGFGLVITEAMSQGTPVITTERTAGPDLIEDSENGWIINAGDTDHLINTLENIVLNRYLLKRTGENAMEKAKKRPWAKYGSELARKIATSI